MRSRTIATSLAFALLLATPALAGPTLTKDEKSALKTIERELTKLASYAAKGKAYPAAKAALDLALEVIPESKKVEREARKLEKKASRAKKGPKASFADKLTTKREAAHTAVALALADAALATEAAAPARYARYLELIQTRFPSQEALDRLDLVYFAPYYQWVSRTEADLLQSGGERHDGETLDAAAVAALDAQHATWSNPWVLSDDVHEVRTTVSLRKAKQILAYVGAYRTYFLGRFGGSWDLKAPKGKLPIIVTRTQAELRQQMDRVAGALGGQAGQEIQGAAFYMQTNGALNPCFVTYEPKEATGMTFQVTNFEQLQIPLAHEVTHQIAFEYSKHAADATRQIQHQFWAVEAIANYMGYHSFDGTRWTLTHPRTIPMGHGMIEGPFAYCVNNTSRLPALRDFTALSRQQFLTVENYHVAATLAYFLLEGEGGKYREGFVRLLQTVHRVNDRPSTFTDAFPGVDRDAMQGEWLRFVRGLQLDS